MSYVRRSAVRIVGYALRQMKRRNLRRAIERSGGPYRVEVGSGRSRRPGWICTDTWWRASNYMDATARWPFPDGSISHVYSDNMIEHLRMEPNRRWLAEAFRTLAPGGRIRISTPDVGRLAGIYLTRGPNADLHLERARQSGYEAHHAVDLLRIVFQDAGHYEGYLWDFDALASELKRAGFVDVARVESGQSDDDALCGLELRAPLDGAPVDLTVEARRPSSATRMPAG